MSVSQLESAVRQLPKAELSAFADWFEEYLDEEWDRQIESDARAGKLNVLIQEADEEIAAGRCTPL